jgi:hypothetical protein
LFSLFNETTTVFVNIAPGGAENKAVLGELIFENFFSFFLLCFSIFLLPPSSFSSFLYPLPLPLSFSLKNYNFWLPPCDDET